MNEINYSCIIHDTEECIRGGEIFDLTIKLLLTIVKVFVNQLHNFVDSHGGTKFFEHVKTYYIRCILTCNSEGGAMRIDNHISSFF